MIDPNGTRINPLDHVGGGGGGLPKTSTEQDGVPGTIFWQRAQNWLRIESGYQGPIHGDPGTNTWAAAQRLAAAHGYTGPIDGALGPNSWRGFARFLNQDRWS